MCMLYVSHEGMSNVVRGERMDDTKNVKEKKRMQCIEMLKGEEVPSNLKDEAAWRRKRRRSSKRTRRPWGYIRKNK